MSLLSPTHNGESIFCLTGNGKRQSNFSNLKKLMTGFQYHFADITDSHASAFNSNTYSFYKRVT